MALEFSKNSIRFFFYPDCYILVSFLCIKFCDLFNNFPTGIFCNDGLLGQVYFGQYFFFL